MNHQHHDSDLDEQQQLVENLTDLQKFLDVCNNDLIAEGDKCRTEQQDRRSQLGPTVRICAEHNAAVNKELQLQRSLCNTALADAGEPWKDGKPPASAADLDFSWRPTIYTQLVHWPLVKHRLTEADVAKTLDNLVADRAKAGKALKTAAAAAAGAAAPAKAKPAPAVEKGKTAAAKQPSSNTLARPTAPLTKGGRAGGGKRPAAGTPGSDNGSQDDRMGRHSRGNAGRPASTHSPSPSMSSDQRHLSQMRHDWGDRGYMPPDSQGPAAAFGNHYHDSRAMPPPRYQPPPQEQRPQYPDQRWQQQQPPQQRQPQPLFRNHEAAMDVEEAPAPVDPRGPTQQENLLSWQVAAGWVQSVSRCWENDKSSQQQRLAVQDVGVMTRCLLEAMKKAHAMQLILPLTGLQQSHVKHLTPDEITRVTAEAFAGVR